MFCSDILIKQNKTLIFQAETAFLQIICWISFITLIYLWLKKLSVLQLPAVSSTVPIIYHGKINFIIQERNLLSAVKTIFSSAFGFSFKNLCVKYIVVLVQNDRAKSNNVGEMSMKCALLIESRLSGRVIHSSFY